MIKFGLLNGPIDPISKREFMADMSDLYDLFAGKGIFGWVLGLNTAFGEAGATAGAWSPNDIQSIMQTLTQDFMKNHPEYKEMVEAASKAYIVSITENTIRKITTFNDN